MKTSLTWTVALLAAVASASPAPQHSNDRPRFPSAPAPKLRPLYRMQSQQARNGLQWMVSPTETAPKDAPPMNVKFYRDNTKTSKAGSAVFTLEIDAKTAKAIRSGRMINEQPTEDFMLDRRAPDISWSRLEERQLSGLGSLGKGKGKGKGSGGLLGKLGGGGGGNPLEGLLGGGGAAGALPGLLGSLGGGGLPDIGGILGGLTGGGGSPSENAPDAPSAPPEAGGGEAPAGPAPKAPGGGLGGLLGGLTGGLTGGSSGGSAPSGGLVGLAGGIGENIGTRIGKQIGETIGRAIGKQIGEFIGGQLQGALGGLGGGVGAGGVDIALNYMTLDEETLQQIIRSHLDVPLIEFIGEEMPAKPAYV